MLATPTTGERLGSPYRAGRVDHRLKVKYPDAPAAKREAEGEWRCRTPPSATLDDR